MRLTDYTDYSLRTLMYLGLNPERLVTIQDIADAYGISKSHLMKVVHQLGVAGFIETVRGRNGGLRLAREPREINLGQVVRSTEPDFAMAACHGKAGHGCVIAPACELKDVLRQATGAYFGVLDGVSLAQLLRNSPALRKLTTVELHPHPRKAA